MRIDPVREAELLAKVEELLPGEAGELRLHLREMRNDRWAREVIEHSVEVMSTVNMRLEMLEKTVDGARVDAQAKIATYERLIEDLISAETKKVTAEAESRTAAAQRNRTIGEGLKEVMASKPALVFYGILALWLAQRLGVVLDSGVAQLLLGAQ